MTPRFTIWSFGRNLKTTSPTPHLQCVSSVIAQENRDWHMLLVDDGSDDGTYEWLEPQVQGEPRITLIRNPERIGKMANFIRLFPRFAGEIAVELDADDWLSDATVLTKVAGAYDSDAAIECTVGRWYDPRNNSLSGNIHSVHEGLPRPLQSYDALRTWKTDLMRRAISDYPACFINPVTGKPWASSADAATMQPILHMAKRVIDLGHYAYTINDHEQRDAQIDRTSQWNTTQRLQDMWQAIKDKQI